MKKYIYINYFRDSNPERKAEYLTCINNNLSLDFIDGLVVFLEKPEHGQDLPQHQKIITVDLPRRMEFRDCLEHAEKTLDKESLVIMLNLDIYLEDSSAWRNIGPEFFDVGYPMKTLVCQRHNIREDGSLWIEERNWRKGDFCDAWIIKTPVDPRLLQEDIGFCVGGAPQCDNLMMYLMSKYYHVFYWGEKYRIFHLDNCRKNDSTSQMITNSATDWRPSKRKNEHIDITAYQDWNTLLAEQRRPEYRPTWGLQNVSFIVDIPKIF